MVNVRKLCCGEGKATHLHVSMNDPRVVHIDHAF